MVFFCFGCSKKKVASKNIRLNNSDHIFDVVSLFISAALAAKSQLLTATSGIINKTSAAPPKRLLCQQYIQTGYIFVKALNNSVSGCIINIIKRYLQFCQFNNIINIKRSVHYWPITIDLCPASAPSNHTTGTGITDFVNKNTKQ